MKDKHRVVKLLKNYIYPTYQLHAVMRSRKLSLEEGLKVGVLTVLEWVRERLGEDVPLALKLPSWQDYSAVTLEQLVSFHLNAGFVIDIVSIPEKGLWSLQITEPDLGSDPGNPKQGRKPVAGRIMATSVSFVINDMELECGVKIVMSDPKNTPLADVYRPAFVKRLYNNRDFGLKQVVPIAPQLKYINSQDSLKSFFQLRENSANQMPCVVFSKVRKIMVGALLPRVTIKQLEAADKEKYVYDAAGNRRYLVQVKKEEEPEAPQVDKPEEKVSTARQEKLRVYAQNPLPVTPEVAHSQEREEKEAKVEIVRPPYEMERLAGEFAGYAQVYLCEMPQWEQLLAEIKLEARAGDIIVLEPKCFGGRMQVLPLQEAISNTKKLRAFISTYPREKAVNYGDVYFLSGARDDLVNRTEEVKEDAAKKEKEREMAYVVEAEKLKSRLAEKDIELAKIENQLGKEKQKVTLAEQRALEQSEESVQKLKIQDKKIESLEQQIKYLRQRAQRPHTKKELANWVRTTLGEHLVLLPRAEDMLEGATINNDRLELIYDSLEYLATDYWEHRFTGLTEEELNNRSSLKYQRGFTVTPNSDSSINTYPNQYKITEYKEKSGRLATKAFAYHLKAGNKAEHLVRIYFFYDEARRLIVVGSLPEHLDTVS